MARLSRQSSILAYYELRLGASWTYPALPFHEKPNENFVDKPMNAMLNQC